LVGIDKLDKIGREGVLKELLARGISESSSNASLNALESVPAFEKLIAKRETGVAARARIEEIVDLVAGTPAGRHVSFVPRLARGLSYYTGAIMEISVPDLAGSLGGGGRYDNLVGMFLGRDVPACGFSLGLERIIVVMTERGMFPAHVAASNADVMVTVWNDSSRSDALSLAGELRRGGLRVDVYPDTDKLGKQFKYASGRNVPFVTIVGDDERAAGTVSVKDMGTGAQLNMPRDEVAPFIRTRTSGTPGTAGTSGTSET
jgi:histidyl-tRNA synthetase